MRISQIEILGAIRPMCFSARLAITVKEKYGSIEEDDIIRRENRFK